MKKIELTFFAIVILIPLAYIYMKSTDQRFEHYKGNDDFPQSSSIRYRDLIVVDGAILAESKIGNDLLVVQGEICGLSEVNCGGLKCELATRGSWVSEPLRYYFIGPGIGMKVVSEDSIEVLIQKTVRDASSAYARTLFEELTHLHAKAIFRAKELDIKPCQHW